MDLIQVSTTAASSLEAQKIADRLVKDQLAACVQVAGPLTSTYRWEGSIEKTEEFVCIAKTRGELLGRVTAAIKSVHSYENPEIISVAIDGGSPDYLHWIGSETTPQGG